MFFINFCLVSGILSEMLSIMQATALSAFPVAAVELPKDRPTEIRKFNG